MNVAVIPARGGSKRIPRKNIREFCGKPMIAWPIEVAKQSDLFDHILVSTDDEEIAEVSKSYGAEIRTMRPVELADDHTGTTEVIAHAVSWMQEQGWTLNAVCCIYATAPLIQMNDLIEAYKLFQSNQWSFVLSATTFPFPIQRAFKKKDSGGIEMFQPNHFESRSQDLEEAYYDAGQFYFGKPEAWINNERIFQNNSEIVVLPNWRVQDIDTKDQWRSAEILMNHIHKGT